VAGAALEREPVQIDAAVHDCVGAYRQAAQQRHVSVAVEVAPDTGSAQLDPKALRRMLDVLLDNAIKFNHESGSVTLSARRDQKTIEITVTDSGIGIAPENLNKLFQPLVQLDASLARQYGGIGIGLALAQRLAALHGGGIEVQSELGKGSTFTLRLPLGEAA
jgi:signal transduction histidine kinase